MGRQLLYLGFLAGILVGLHVLDNVAEYRALLVVFDGVDRGLDGVGGCGGGGCVGVLGRQRVPLVGAAPHGDRVAEGDSDQLGCAGKSLSSVLGE